MKKDTKKPRKKRRRKPDTGTRIYAVLAAAVLILTALVTALVTMNLHSEKTRIEAALAPVPEELSAEPISVAPSLAPLPSDAPPPAEPVPVPVAPVTAIPVKQPPVSVTPTAKQLPPAVVERPPLKGTLAFVLDDAGNNLRDLEPFLKFPGGLTIAVLPGLSNSAEAARRIRAAGKEVFLHQPMESLGGRDPGPGAIRAGMSRGEIRAIINRNLDELWPVAGMNNHEGSRITMDDEAMDTVLALCRERGILFLDSRTTAETAAPRAARRLGIVIGERDVFVDNVQERGSMLDYINTGLTKAEQNGSVIMIGHVTSPALAPLLAELYPSLTEKGYSFSPVSKIIRGTNP